MRKWYLGILKKLCKREIDRINRTQPTIDKEDLLNYYRHLAIICLDPSSASRRALLNVTLATIKILERSYDLASDHNHSEVWAQKDTIQ
jgi:hypothetical protein